MTEKKTALAEQSAAPEKPKGPIKGARLIRIARGDVRYPAAIYKGEAPAKGSKIMLKMGNGSTYSGIVHDATEADGDVIVEFRDGLTVQK
jgi:hypothetical protein